MNQEQLFAFHQLKVGAIRELEEVETEDEELLVNDDHRVFQMLTCSSDETELRVLFKLCRDGRCQEYKHSAADFVQMLYAYSKGISKISDRCSRDVSDYCSQCVLYPNEERFFSCSGEPQTCENFSIFGNDRLRCNTNSGKLEYLSQWDNLWDLTGYEESTEGGFDDVEQLEHMLYCAADFGTLDCSRTQKFKGCMGWCEMLVDVATWTGESMDIPTAQPTGLEAYGMQFCRPKWQTTHSPTLQPVSLESPMTLSQTEGSKHQRSAIGSVSLAITSGLVCIMLFVWHKRQSSLRYYRIARDESTNSPADQDFEYRSVELSDLGLCEDTGITS